MKLSTINLIVEGVLESSYARHKANGLTDDEAEEMAMLETNSVCIALKAGSICEASGIDAAMQYYEGSHSSQEFQEFRTQVVSDWLGKKKKEIKKR